MGKALEEKNSVEKSKTEEKKRERALALTIGQPISR